MVTKLSEPKNWKILKFGGRRLNMGKGKGHKFRRASINLEEAARLVTLFVGRIPKKNLGKMNSSNLTHLLHGLSYHVK